MKNNTAERLKFFLSNESKRKNLIVVGDLYLWRDISKESRVEPIFEKSLVDKSKAEFNKNLSQLNKILILQGRSKVLCIDCPSSIITHLLYSMEPFSELIICQSRNMELLNVDLYSSVHSKNLTVSVL